MSLLRTATALLTCVLAARAEQITCEASDHSFSRGYCGISHSTDPESWVRGSAALDRSTGELDYKVDLETDHVHRGPKGSITIHLFNGSGKEVAAMNGGEFMIGGKCQGQHFEHFFEGKAWVPVSMASQTVRIVVEAHHNGSVNGCKLTVMSDAAIKAALAAVSVVLR